MDAGFPGTRYESVCAGWAARYCLAQQGCPFSVRWEEPDQCVQRTTLSCEMVANNPDVSFDPARLEACATPDAGVCSVPGMCLGPGRAPLGAPCVINEACDSGFCAMWGRNPAGSAWCGWCETITPVCGGKCKAGEACIPTDDGGERCATQYPTGGPCQKDGECFSGICDHGKCVPPSPPVPLGGACGADAGLFCELGRDFCDSTSHCAPMTFAYYGQPCIGQGSLTEDIVCRGYAACDYSENLCVPPAGDGDFCDGTQALGCLYPAVCVDHVCRFPEPGTCTPSLWR
jgi:hypothetical protein